MAKSKCAVDGCEARAYKRAWCNRHYLRWRRFGSPTASAPRSTVEERFWAKVDKQGAIPAHRPELGPCWLWTAGRNGRTYGSFAAAPGPPLLAHRWSYEYHEGPIPRGMCVLHHCDNPPCVNPAHLFLGTKADNTADMIAKGRDRTPSKLTPTVIAEIRAAFTGVYGEQAALARRYGVSPPTIHRVLHP